MTSTPSLNDILTNILTTHEYNDVTGTVTVNIADALLAIANAINRLAAVQERNADRQAKSVAAFDAVIMDNLRTDGHA